MSMDHCNEGQESRMLSMHMHSSDKDKKKKKKKSKEKERAPSSRKIKDSPPQAEEGFGDNFFLARNSKNPDDWAQKTVIAAEEWDKDDTSGWESSVNGSGKQVSHATQATEATTLSRNGSEHGCLPFTTIDVQVGTGAQQGQQQQPYLVTAPHDSGAVDQVHSEMLQGFLNRNGHDATMAVATAAAFDNFLTHQHDFMQQLQGSDQGNYGDGFDDDDDEERRMDGMECMESVADDAMFGSFTPDSFRDDGSAIFNEKAQMIEEYMRQQNDDAIRETREHRKEEAQFDEKALMMAEYMQNEHIMKQAPEDGDETEESADYHGEVLQDFLERHGNGGDVAGQTASAFQEFLERQKDALSRPTQEIGIPMHTFISPGASRESGFSNTRRNDNFGRNLSQLTPSEGNSGRKTRNLLAKKQTEYSVRSVHLFQGENAVDNRKTAPVAPERTILVQLADLTNSQLACMELIRKQAKGRFNVALCLRFARCTDFKAKAALKVMKKFQPNMLQISIVDIEKLLRTRLIYPLPGVIGRGGINSKSDVGVCFDWHHESIPNAFLSSLTVFYMQFKLVVPRNIPIHSFSNLLIFVMNCMHETEANCVNGIGLIADLTDFSMANCSIQYMSKFLMLVQGRQFPVKVESIFFVNAPKWFGAVWGIMKQMMSTDFLTTNVHRISFNDLLKSHLEPGWEAHMTTDIFVGTRNADQIVAQFIEQRKGVESSRFTAGARR
jgi:hypothetical protein